MSLSSKPEIVPLSPGQEPPWHLLLLADPFREKVEQYVYAGSVFLALLDGEAIGVLVLRKQNSTMAEIMNIAVAEAYQGMGIGRQLIQYALDVAKAGDYTRLRIATGNSSIGQLALYQQEGFDIIEIQKNYFMLHYPEPIFENGIRCRHLIILEHIL